MARGHVEVFNLSGAPRRADAILERVEFFLKDGRYTWTFMGTSEAGVLGNMTTSDRKSVCAFNARSCDDVCNLVKSDRGKPADKQGEVLIGEAHLIPRGDLERIKHDLTGMGINVRLYKER